MTSPAPSTSGITGPGRPGDVVAAREHEVAVVEPRGVHSHADVARAEMRPRQVDALEAGGLAAGEDVERLHGWAPWQGSGHAIGATPAEIGGFGRYCGDIHSPIGGATADRFDGIEVFVHAVQAGSFAQASDRLALSRSAVAKGVGRLEQRLGVRQFHRTTRRRSLTEDGQAFYERCVRALVELEAGEAVLDGGRREPRGRLRVSVPVLFGRCCVAPALQALVAAHPQLDLDIAFSDRLVDVIEEGYDLAVRVGPLADRASLAARRLGTQGAGICASPAYLARRSTPTTAESFEGHAAVTYARNGHELPWVVRAADGGLREVRLGGRLRMDDLQAIADAACAGAGLTLLPCWLLQRHIAAGQLVLVCDSSQVQGADIHAVWPRSRHMTSKTRAAVHALVDGVPRLMGQAWWGHGAGAVVAPCATARPVGGAQGGEQVRAPATPAAAVSPA